MEPLHSDLLEDGRGTQPACTAVEHHRRRQDAETASPGRMDSITSAVASALR